MSNVLPDTDFDFVLKDLVVIIFVEVSGKNEAFSLNIRYDTLLASSQRITFDTSAC